MSSDRSSQRPHRCRIHSRGGDGCDTGSLRHDPEIDISIPSVFGRGGSGGRDGERMGWGHEGRIKLGSTPALHRQRGSPNCYADGMDNMGLSRGMGRLGVRSRVGMGNPGPDDLVDGLGGISEIRAQLGRGLGSGPRSHRTGGLGEDARSPRGLRGELGVRCGRDRSIQLEGGREGSMEGDAEKQSNSSGLERFRERPEASLGADLTAEAFGSGPDVGVGLRRTSSLDRRAASEDPNTRKAENNAETNTRCNKIPTPPPCCHHGSPTEDLLRPDQYQLGHHGRLGGSRGIDARRGGIDIYDSRSPLQSLRGRHLDRHPGLPLGIPPPRTGLLNRQCDFSEAAHGSIHSRGRVGPGGGLGTRPLHYRSTCLEDYRTELEAAMEQVAIEEEIISRARYGEYGGYERGYPYRQRGLGGSRFGVLFP
jgi:hypothetical protein